MYSTLVTELTDHILTITINRPEKMNALSNAVLEDLDKVVKEVYDNAEVRAAIITGAGPKAFVAGADISEFMNLSIEQGAKMAKRGQDIFARIENCTKPFVAAVNGFALGGGCELAMSCHFRLASENAKFGQPEVNLGLIPGYGGTQRLTQLIGKGKAIELMMTANMIGAEEARQLGLVNYVTSPDKLLEQTRQLLTLILTKSPSAVGKVINAVNAYFDKSSGRVADGFAEEIRLFGECFGSDEMKEGVNAFLEKRKADFYKK